MKKIQIFIIKMDKYIKESSPPRDSEERLQWEIDLIKFLTTAKLDEVKKIIESHTVAEGDYTECHDYNRPNTPLPPSEMFDSITRNNYGMENFAIANAIILNKDQSVKDYLSTFYNKHWGDYGESLSYFYDNFATTGGMEKVDFIIENMILDGVKKEHIAENIMNLDTYRRCDIGTVKALKYLYDKADTDLYYVSDECRTLRKFMELVPLLLKNEK